MNREWTKFVDQSIRELFQRTAHIPVRARSGGSGGSFPYYEAPTKAELPAGVAHNSRGFITGGDLAGGWCVRNSDNTAWVGETFWEVV